MSPVKPIFRIQSPRTGRKTYIVSRRDGKSFLAPKITGSDIPVDSITFDNLKAVSDFVHKHTKAELIAKGQWRV